jgi:hypothetical protein
METKLRGAPSVRQVCDPSDTNTSLRLRSFAGFALRKFFVVGTSSMTVATSSRTRKTLGLPLWAFLRRSFGLSGELLAATNKLFASLNPNTHGGGGVGNGLPFARTPLAWW